MLELKFVRENAELVKNGIIAKKSNVDIDKLLELDAERRKLQFDFDTNKAHQNRVSKEIADRKRNKQDAADTPQMGFLTYPIKKDTVADMLSEMQTLSNTIKETTNRISALDIEIEQLLINIPNLPDPSVPIGKDESDNVIVREWGVKWNDRPDFTAKPLDHIEIAQALGMLDTTRGAKISGSGFPIYTNIGAKLERALINFMLDFHLTNHQYQELSVPLVVNRQSMLGTGQLPKLENDMYHIDEDDLFLIPTGEVPVTNIYANEILENKVLPAKYVTYTPCFRREAGSYGKDTKGLQRLHQFNKVEMVRFVHPEQSWDALEEMTNQAEAILQALDLPYRVLNLSTGDLSFASAKTYDLEVWAPGMKKYLEVSSISNFLDFQARRASIRYRGDDGKVRFVHTLNGSGLATPRTFIAILENYQNSDDTVTIPEALRPYMNGLTKIESFV